MRLKLNLVVLVLEDHAYGMIRWKQATDGFPDFGMTFGDPDFVAYAKAYGAKGSRVETADGFAPTLEAAFAAGGVHLVVDPGRLFGEQAGPGRRAARQRVGERREHSVRSEAHQPDRLRPPTRTVEVAGRRLADIAFVTLDGAIGETCRSALVRMERKLHFALEGRGSRGHAGSPPKCAQNSSRG